MAMQVFNVGQVLAASDVNEYLVNTRFAAKPGDTNRISTSTLANDGDLTLAVDASKTYMLDILGQYSSAAAAGFKFAFTVPAGATLNGTYQTDLATNGGTYDQSGSFGPTAARSLAASGVGLDNSFFIRAILITSATSGSITFQWAQNASTGSNTTLRQGSSMLLRRVS